MKKIKCFCGETEYSRHWENHYWYTKCKACGKITSFRFKSFWRRLKQLI